MSAGNRVSLEFAPESGEWAGGAGDGIGRGKGEVGHAVEGVGGGSGAADIPELAGGVGADDEEIGAGAEAAVTCASGESDDVSGAQGEIATAGSGAAERDVDLTGGDTEDLVGGGVEMMKGVDAVAPLRRPAGGVEGAFHGGGEGGWIGRWGEGAAIEEDGEVGVVGYPAVGGKDEVLRRPGWGLGGDGEAGG